MSDRSTAVDGYAELLPGWRNTAALISLVAIAIFGLGIQYLTFESSYKIYFFARQSSASGAGRS